MCVWRKKKGGGNLVLGKGKDSADVVVRAMEKALGFFPPLHTESRRFMKIKIA